MEKQSRLAPPTRPILPPITGGCSQSSQSLGSSANAGDRRDSSPFRIIWDFPLRSSANMVKSALASLLSEGDMLLVSVRKSYRSSSDSHPCYSGDQLSTSRPTCRLSPGFFCFLLTYLFSSTLGQALFGADCYKLHCCGQCISFFLVFPLFVTLCVRSLSG